VASAVAIKTAIEEILRSWNAVASSHGGSLRVFSPGPADIL
jgi:hypothetical protein